jgi:hypothetical protein
MWAIEVNRLYLNMWQSVGAVHLNRFHFICRPNQNAGQHSNFLACQGCYFAESPESFPIDVKRKRSAIRQPSRRRTSKNRTPICDSVATVRGLAMAKSRADVSSDQMLSQVSIAVAVTDVRCSSLLFSEIANSAANRLCSQLAGMPSRRSQIRQSNQKLTHGSARILR